MNNNKIIINYFFSFVCIGLTMAAIKVDIYHEQWFTINCAFAQGPQTLSLAYQQNKYILLVIILFFLLAILIWLVLKKQTSKLQSYNDIDGIFLTQKRQSHWYVYIFAILLFLIVFIVFNKYISYDSSDIHKSMNHIQSETKTNANIQPDTHSEQKRDKVHTEKPIPNSTDNISKQSISKRTDNYFNQKVPERTSINSIGMTFVLIPPGSFQMGSPLTEKQRKQSENLHSVKLSKGFYMQTTEITNEQFVLFLNQTHIDKKWFSINDGYIKHYTNKYTVYPKYKRYPAISLSWFAVDAMARWLTKKEKVKYRIPTEAEWEYAARAGTTSPFYYGDCLTTDHANYNGNKPYVGCQIELFRNRPIPVGKLNRPNKWNLHDMHGNVNEWCFDWFIRKYSMKKPCIDPTGPKTGFQKVVRGGCYKYGANECRSAVRNRFKPHFKGKNIGGRLVREIE